MTLPLFKTKPTIVTIHDLIPLVYSDKFPSGTRGSLKWQIQRMSLRGIAAVITDSQASKNDIERLTGLSQELINVVYLAPSDRFQKITDNKILADVKEKYQLPDKFILYVGDINWNKNITSLIKAFSKLKNTHINFKLVLVGKAFLEKNLAEAKELYFLIKELNLTDEVIMTGFVEEVDLASVYSLASVYVQPSFAEGFGFPVLEAMACGCPTVVSNTSSLKEIAGPSVLVNPNVQEDMCQVINSIISLTPKKFQELSKKGIDWSKKFTWENTAKETVKVYEKVLARH